MSCSRTINSRGTPIRSSLGASSFPVSDSPASFQPTLIHGPIPSDSTTGSPGTRHSTAMTDASDAGDEVVGVRDPDVAVGRGRRRGDEVAAPPVHDLAGRGLRGAHGPDLLDRGREQLERVDARTLCRSVDLVHQPRRGRERRVPVAGGERELLLAGPAGRQVGMSNATALRMTSAHAAPICRPTSRCDPSTTRNGRPPGARSATASTLHASARSPTGPRGCAAWAAAAASPRRGSAGTSPGPGPGSRRAGTACPPRVSSWLSSGTRMNRTGRRSERRTVNSASAWPTVVRMSRSAVLDQQRRPDVRGVGQRRDLVEVVGVLPGLPPELDRGPLAARDVAGEEQRPHVGDRAGRSARHGTGPCCRRSSW